jgi:hypothetical protein
MLILIGGNLGVRYGKKTKSASIVANVSLLLKKKGVEKVDQGLQVLGRFRRS